MARFYYIAQDKFKRLTEGEVQAQSRGEVMANLTKQGLSPVKIEEVADVLAGRSLWRRLTSLQLSFSKNLTIMDQITLIRHLGTILNTGTSLTAGLDMVAQDAIKPAVRRILHDLKDKISKGQTFSGALTAWKEQFNPIFISLVKAGEASGNLPGILMSYSRELRKDYTFMRKFKGAMVYPAILVTALVAMVMLILTVVTPRLQELFDSTHTVPPLYTRIFFGISHFWLAYTIPILAVVSLLAVVLIIALQNKRTRNKLSGLIWYLPFFRGIQKNLTLMRMCKTLHHLIDAGFSLKASIEVAGEVVSEKYRRVLVNIAAQKLEKGVNFSDALKEHGDLFPGILTSVVATGEKSGQLSGVFDQMAEFYEEEVIYQLELFLTLIEPILLIIIGVIVGLMTSSLIAPVYRLIGRFR